MRTIIRDNYTPKPGDYHDMYVFDEARGKSWRFDCDGVFYETTIENELGDSTTTAASQALVTSVAGDLDGKIQAEAEARSLADAHLQEEIDDLKNSPDVVDIVDTYADLQAYDTSHLGDKDVIRVLSDETHDGDSSYYRWSTDTQTWTYIGSIHIDERAFKPFPDSVVTDGTTQQFFNSILALQPETGMAYLGTVTLSDMPAGLIQEEVEVYVYSDYVVYGVMRSTDVAPYQWWAASYNYQGWLPVGGGGTKTTFYANTSETGTTRHIYSDDTCTTAATAQEIYDASQDGLVVLRSFNINTPTQFNEVTLLNVWQSPSDNDYQFIFAGDGAAYTYGADALTDDTFYYYTANFLFGNRVQVPGTSTTDIMSQNAVTEMVWADPNPRNHVNIGGSISTLSSTNPCVAIGKNALITSGGGNNPMGNTVIGSSADARNRFSTAIGSGTHAYGYESVALGSSSTSSRTEATGSGAVSIGTKASASATGAIALGSNSASSTQGEMNIGTSNTTHGYNNSNYRLISGVYDGQAAHDAATKGQLDAVSIQNAGAPTTSTAGSVGQLLQDTTNGDLYICTAVDITDPNNPVYTWEEVGGGPNVVQTTGASTTDVMSQKAVTDTIFADSGNERKIRIGKNADSSGNNTVAIGYQAKANNNANAVVVGPLCTCSATSGVIVGSNSTIAMNANNSVAIGAGANASGQSAVSVGSTNTTAGNGVGVGYDVYARAGYSTAIGAHTNVSSNAQYGIALGCGASATQRGQMDISVSGTGTYSGNGYNNSDYRLLTGLYDPQSDHDAATKGYVDTAIAGAGGASEINSTDWSALWQ